MQMQKLVFLLVSLLMAAGSVTAEPNPIVIGLDADMSLGSARSGEAIRRGMEIAVEEINTDGGILGRSLRIEVRDHKGNPARGNDNIEEFAAMQDLVAVVGGLHTPVALHELKAIHVHRLIFLVPWAAGTNIVENGYSPNNVFRISVRDEFAGGVLVQKALDGGHSKLALVLESTGWGRSNEKAMRSALEAKRLQPISIVWFHWGEGNTKKVVEEVLRSGADAILLVANAPEGLDIVRSMADLPPDRRVPILSHWGITGGNFFMDGHDAIAAVDLTFLQTFSFLAPQFRERSERVVAAYVARYPDARSAREIFAPVGTAHAYDLVRVLARAIEMAGSIDRSAVRDALEHIDRYEGLVREYAPPFTPERHDGLDASDFRMARFAEDGAIVPLDQ